MSVRIVNLHKKTAYAINNVFDTGEEPQALSTPWSLDIRGAVTVQRNSNDGHDAGLCVGTDGGTNGICP